MSRRILIPLDGTKLAETALGAIPQVCLPADEIVLLHIDKPREAERSGSRPSAMAGEIVGTNAGNFTNLGGPDLPRFAETHEQALQGQIDDATDYLETIAIGLRKAGYTVTTEVVFSEKPEVAIVDYARAMKPTLIAMHRRTHSGLGEILMGSVTSSVIRSEVAPVLVVPSA